MRNRLYIVFIAAITLLTLGLSGCGQKGPLVPPKALATAAVQSLVC